MLKNLKVNYVVLENEIIFVPVYYRIILTKDLCFIVHNYKDGFNLKGLYYCMFDCNCIFFHISLFSLLNAYFSACSIFPIKKKQKIGFHYFNVKMIFNAYYSNYLKLRVYSSISNNRINMSFFFLLLQ